MKTLRDLAGDKPYYEINREERNFAAILYHLLLDNNNLELFLNKIDSSLTNNPSENAVYFEYAYIRDLWNQLDEIERESQNRLKKEFILSSLGVRDSDPLFQLNPEDFNHYFGAVRTPSKTKIVSPANWSYGSFDEKMTQELFAKACELKWCFNAKPDLVIQTSKSHAICIEAKLESGQGNYNATKNEKSHQAGQFEIQRKLMTEILGIECEYLIIAKNKPRISAKYFSADSEKKTDTKLITWNFIFDLFQSQFNTEFLKKWKDQNEQLKISKDANSDEFIYVVNH